MSVLTAISSSSRHEVHDRIVVPPIKTTGVTNASAGSCCLLHRSPRRGEQPPEPLPADDGVDWKRLSSEFRQILVDGALEPTEVHAKYHREFKKV